MNEFITSINPNSPNEHKNTPFRRLLCSIFGHRFEHPYDYFNSENNNYAGYANADRYSWNDWRIGYYTTCGRCDARRFYVTPAQAKEILKIERNRK